MAALVDSLLKLLSAQGADTLVIPSTEPPRLEKRGEPKALSMPPMGREMVEAMIEDLTDPTQRDRVSGGASIETRYEALDDQVYAVLIEPKSDGPRLTLRRLEGDTMSSASSSASSPSPSPATAAPPPAPAGTPGTRGVADPPSFPAAPAPSEPSPPPPDSSSTPPAANEAPLVEPRVDSLQALGPEPILDPGPLAAILGYARQEQASDILLSSGGNGRLRVAGNITELSGQRVEEVGLRAFLAPVLGARARHELAHAGSTDLALRVRLEDRVERYRGNAFLQHGGLALALRPVRDDPPTLARLNLPEQLAELAELPNGLVLMTGTAGSGKSTTLVALIEHINRHAPKHIITLEDPIEYEYENRRSLVHQRQVGVHVRSFADGLRAALRESPDVILVGEMRDPATMKAALTAAETGHLVFSTLHSADAAMAVDRIVDSVPEHQQTQVRVQLASTLRAVVTQRLLPARTRPLLVPAVELMRVNVAVATKIREGRGHQILSEIQKGQADGMLSFERTTAALVRQGLLQAEVAMAHSANPALMAEQIRGYR